MKKRFLIFLLSALLLLPSCGKKAETHEYDPNSEFDKENGDEFSDIPSGDYSGFVYKVLSADGSSPAAHFDAEELTGDTVSDVIYLRNSDVESRINVNIEEECDTAENTVKKAAAAVLAGDTSYSLICAPATDMATLALGGYLLDSETVPGIDLNKSWWYKEASYDASVGNRLYGVFGDIQLSFYDAHSMVGFNMSIAEDISGMENPYDLADSGKWTFTKMYEMSKAAFSDVDGNGIYDTDDRYGVAISGDEMPSLLFGCGMTYSVKDDYGIPTVTCPTDEAFYDTFRLIYENLFMTRTYVYDTKVNSADGYSPASLFKGARTLFLVTTVGELYSLRTMNYEFGILPMPKADEKDAYVSLVSGADAMSVGFPVSCRDTERAGIITENIAARSHIKDGIRNHYVDSVLSFRYVNDERSRKNLSVILTSGKLDTAEIFGFGGINEAVSNLSDSIASYPTKMSGVKRQALADIADALSDIEE